MAILRILYRRRHALFICLCASSFWLCYIFLSLPSNSDKTSVASSGQQHLIHAKNLKKVEESIRKVITEPTTERKPTVIEAPNVVIEGEVKGLENPVPREKSPPQDRSHLNVKDKVKPSKISILENSSMSNETDAHPLTEKQVGNFDKVLEIGQKLKNKTLEFGESFKNKTYEVGAQFKNKTLEKLSELGVIKPISKKNLIYIPNQWKMNLSLEDVGNIMKDTEYLIKAEKLDINYPKLIRSNATYTEGNETKALRNVTMSNAIGLCDCLDYDCTCCANIQHKKMHLNLKSCTNITYISKSQDFEFRFMVGDQIFYKDVIPVDKPPKVCLASVSRIAAVCASFLSVSSSVNIHETHKLRVIGCLEYSLTLYNKTVSAYPVDCFQMPGSMHRKKEHEELQDFVNLMP